MIPDALAIAEIADTAVASTEAYQLPKGWAEVHIQEVVEQLTDGTHAPPKFSTSGVPFVVIGNIKQGSIDWASVSKWVSRSTFETEAKRLRPRCDDILYTAVGSYGTAVRVTDDRDFMFQRHIAFLRPDKKMTDPGFLCHALNSPFCKQQADNVARGVAQKTVTLGSLRNFTFPLAPLCEQRRIAARIDELFAEIAEGEAALERARHDLGTWRRAMLKAAVTGELTRDWREANRPIETDPDLVARTRAERHHSIVQRRNRRSVPAEALNVAFLPGLPDSWAWARLDDLGEIVGGVTVDKKRVPDDPVEVPYLRVANVQRGYLDLSEIKSIQVDRHVAGRLNLKTGDVLLNEGGDRDKIGRGWVWQDELPDCIHQNHVFRVRLYHGGINPYFISYYANEMGRAFFMEKGKQTTNLASISLSKISELPVPVPPPAEARIIVDRLNGVLAAEMDTRRELADAQALSRAQRQAILKAAFEGRLVPQDPNEEPASLLLTRPSHVNGMSASRRRGRPRDAAQGALAL
jgi:type I restriction enzyme S subunit